MTPGIRSNKTGAPLRRSTRRTLAACAALAACAVAAALGLAIAANASAGTGDDGPRVIHLHTVLVSSTVNPAGNGGVADVVAALFSVTTPSGQTGHADISCTNFPGGEQLCHAAFVLPDGQLDAQAAIPEAAPAFTAAIIGGTGAYNGATGHIDNTRNPGGIIDRTIYLLPRATGHN
jgi:hypothetical protein